MTPLRELPAHAPSTGLWTRLSSSFAEAQQTCPHSLIKSLGWQLPHLGVINSLLAPKHHKPLVVCTDAPRGKARVPILFRPLHLTSTHKAGTPASTRRRRELPRHGRTCRAMGLSTTAAPCGGQANHPLVVRIPELAPWCAVATLVGAFGVCVLINHPVPHARTPCARVEEVHTAPSPPVVAMSNGD
jgi:hypothetical protein